MEVVKVEDTIYNVLVKFRIRGKSEEKAIENVKKRIKPIEDGDGFDNELFDIEILDVEKEE
jgi:hypothetical protein